MQDLGTYGHQLRAIVRQWTGIPTAIGIAPTKTLAKLANRLAKRTAHGVVVLTAPAVIDATLARTPIADLWGVGPGYTRRLTAHGITTALQLRQAPELWIRQQLGVVGLRLVWELRGMACLPLERCPPPRQSLMVSRSFGRLITTLTEMREAVATYTTRAAEKLRRYQRAASVVTVFVTTNRFAETSQYANEVTVTLPVATQDTGELVTSALRAVERLFRVGYAYKKARVILTALIPAQQVQTDLFDRKDRERSQRLMAAIDAMNARWGPGTVRYAAVGVQPGWRMRCARRSLRTTTRWDELVVVRSA